MHCASLLRMIFTSLARPHERVHVHNIRDFPQAKLNSEILTYLHTRFLLNEHGDLYLLFIILVYKLSSLSYKNEGQNCSQGIKDIAKRVHKTNKQGCELWPRKQRFYEHFEARSFTCIIVWFCLKLYITDVQCSMCPVLSTYQYQDFFKYCINNLCFQLLQM